MKSILVKSSPLQGKGVFAAKNFHKGEVILEIDDDHVVVDESNLTESQHEYDCDYLANGTIILMQEPEKYINHSCDPTSYVKSISGLRIVLAMKDIKEGEEITFDYVINSDNDGTFKCFCGSPECRKTYRGRFFELPHDIQLRYLPYLEDWFKAEHTNELELMKK